MTNSAPITAVMPLLTRCRDSITDLAATLAEGGDIRHGDVCTALGLSADTGRPRFSWPAFGPAARWAAWRR